MVTDPKILILDEPTRGIDIGAKHEIYNLMFDIANNGVSIIFISSEMGEILNLPDRVNIMRGGRLVGSLEKENITDKNIMKMAIGGIMIKNVLNPQKKTSSFNDNKAILIGLVVIMIIVTIIQPNFLSTKNILNILRSIATTGIIAFGMTLAIIIMGIDLSQGSIIGLSACFCAWLIGPDALGLPAGVGILGGITIGCITGAFNG